MNEPIKLDKKFAKAYWLRATSWWAWEKLDDLARDKVDVATVQGFERVARAAPTRQAAAEFAAGALEDLIRGVVKTPGRADVAVALVHSPMLALLLVHVWPVGVSDELHRLAATWQGPTPPQNLKTGIGDKTIAAYWVQNRNFWAQSYIRNLERERDPQLIPVLEFLAKAAPPNKRALRLLSHDPLYGIVTYAIDNRRADLAVAILDSAELPQLIHYNWPKNSLQLLEEIAGRKSAASA